MAQHSQAAPPPLQEKVQEKVPHIYISPAVEQVVLKALAKEPKERFASVQAFALALEQASREVGQLNVAPSSNGSASPAMMGTPPKLSSILPNADASSLSLSVYDPTASLQQLSLDTNALDKQQQPAMIPQLVPASSPMALSTVAPATTSGSISKTLPPAEPSHTSMPPAKLPPSLPPFAPVATHRRPVFSISKIVVVIGLILIALISLSVIGPKVGDQLKSTGNTTATATITPTNTYENYVQANGIMFGFNAQHTHDYPYESILNTTTVSLLAPKWKYPTASSVNSSPAVVNGVVYVGSDDNNLYAINVTNGTVRWKYPTQSTVDSSPAVVGGVVYFGSRDRNFCAVYAASGTLKWKQQVGEIISASPVVVGGVVYIGSQDGYLDALDAVSGTVKWKYQTQGAVESSPAVVSGVAYVGSQDHNLYAINAANGTKVWAYLTQGAVNDSPAVANGVVYVGSDDNNLYAFSL